MIWHYVENYVDEQLSYYDVHFEDMQPDELQRLKQKAKQCDSEDLPERLDDITEYIKQLANEQ